MRVADTRISLDSIVAAFLQGHSSATIQQQYPGLTLEQVVRAIDYYQSHREQVHDYFQHQAQAWRELRNAAESTPSALVERMRAMRTAHDDPKIWLGRGTRPAVGGGSIVRKTASFPSPVSPGFAALAVFGPPLTAG